MFKLNNPPRFFAAVSLLMIIAMVIGTGLVQAPFFRQSIIDREASVVGDMVYAIAVDHQVSSADMQNYTDEQAKPKVPAQRVVNRNGMLSGKHHFATPTLMEELLKKDGVAVKNDTVVDLKKRFWDPLVELSL